MVFNTPALAGIESIEVASKAHHLYYFVISNHPCTAPNAMIIHVITHGWE